MMTLKIKCFACGNEELSYYCQLSDFLPSKDECRKDISVYVCPKCGEIRLNALNEINQEIRFEKNEEENNKRLRAEREVAIKRNENRKQTLDQLKNNLENYKELLTDPSISEEEKQAIEEKVAYTEKEIKSIENKIKRFERINY